MEMPADDLLEQCRQLIEKREKLDLAYKNLNKLLNKTMYGEGDASAVLFYIGSIHMLREEHAMGILVLRECIRHKPGFIEAVNNLGFIYKAAGLFDEAKKCFDEVWRLVQEKPDDIPSEHKADYLTNIGSLLIQNGTPEDALEKFDMALAIDANRDLTRWNRSLALLEMGNYTQGFPEYEYGDRTKRCKERNYGKMNLPEWDGTPGKTVVVYGEQGIGDEIMFASVIPDLIKDAGKVIFDAHPRLVDIFKQAFPNIDVFGTRKTEDKEIKWSKFYTPDAKLAVGSLAKFYRKEEKDFPRVPYLAPDPILDERWKNKLAKLGDKPVIGISWRGGVRSTNTAHRYIPLDMWAEIVKLDAIFVSLQYNEGLEKEVKAFEDGVGVCINHWPDVLADYDETTGLVANLDMVISVPQSVVHLAGALGTPTWQLSPKRAMWQVGAYGQDMPWYGCVKNYWQGEDCAWAPVMNKVKDDLCHLLQMNTAN